MSTHSLPELRGIAGSFALDGAVTDARTIRNGHIHDTCAITVAPRAGGPARDYILQRINHDVFRQPLQVMENIRRVTEHIRPRLADPSRETLTIVPTHAGDACVELADGTWRCFILITAAQSYDQAENAHMVREAALAFGRFSRLLADLPGPPLHETIPNFHHTPTRFATLLDAIERDVANRAATCRVEIDWCLAHQHLVDRLTAPLASGALPTRIVHNDTKINNVMFDDSSGRAVCVIDLDTVMPGTALYDFGDQVRTGAGHFDESTRDLDSVRIDLDWFAALVEGYRDGMGDLLTPVELAGMAEAGQVLTFTIGIRFLADYLAGDRYFRTHWDGQNLDRARVQFRYVDDMADRRDAMEAIVATHG